MSPEHQDWLELAKTKLGLKSSSAVIRMMILSNFKSSNNPGASINTVQVEALKYSIMTFKLLCSELVNKKNNANEILLKVEDEANLLLKKIYPLQKISLKNFD